MREIEEIVADWKVTYGILRQGKFGSYRSIPFEGKRDMLNDLVQTMIDEGYSQEDIKTANTQRLVVKYSCPPPEAKTKNFKKQQDITADQWRTAIVEVFRGKISKYVPKDAEKPSTFKSSAPAKEDRFDYSVADASPGDVLKVDQSGYAETEYDEDFMKDLGVDLKKWSRP